MRNAGIIHFRKRVVPKCLPAPGACARPPSAIKIYIKYIFIESCAVTASSKPENTARHPERDHPERGHQPGPEPDERTAPSTRRAFADDVHARTGIDDAMIETLVHAFYARVRDDALLGPVFAARINDWDAHLARMCAFWSSVVLMTGRYHGRPMPAHAPLPVSGEHFDRWLALFRATARDVCPPAAADLFVAKAQMIAASLETGIAIFRGHILGKGERLPALQT